MSADFAREDEKADGEFYVSPRLVQHIDGGARAAWTQYLGETFLRQGAEASTVAAGGPSPAVSSVDILDLCSSWVSHLPLNPQVRFGRVIGQGMNPAELDANPNLTEVIVRDLNKEPNLKEIPSNSLDAVIVCPHRFVRRLFLHHPHHRVCVRVRGWVSRRTNSEVSSRTFTPLLSPSVDVLAVHCLNRLLDPPTRSLGRGTSRAQAGRFSPPRVLESIFPDQSHCSVERHDRLRTVVDRRDLPAARRLYDGRS
jgi:hypothetical protein